MLNSFQGSEQLEYIYIYVQETRAAILVQPSLFNMFNKKLQDVALEAQTKFFFIFKNIKQNLTNFAEHLP